MKVYLEIVTNKTANKFAVVDREFSQVKSKEIVQEFQERSDVNL